MSNSRLIFPSRVSSLSTLNRLLKGAKYQNAKYFMLVDENSYQYCLPEILARVSAFETAEFFEVPVGEECKSLEIASQIWGGLLESGADKDTILVNIGGGCVSDLGGFVAAGYKRGIRYINIPTTLIGMVDAAIGGKTAVNIEGNKNQVGFFHQPDMVCINPDLLSSLSNEEMINGLFEVIKTFAIANPEMYSQIISDICSGNINISDEIVVECATIKQSVFKNDYKDQGIRKILNFGHTFGHAIESYSHLRHGEAVGVGMLCAIYLSVKKLGLDESIYDDYRRTLQMLIKVPCFNLKDTEGILSYMRNDKKNADGLILCVLLQQIGVPVIDISVSDEEIRDTLLKIGK